MYALSPVLRDCINLGYQRPVRVLLAALRKNESSETKRDARTLGARRNTRLNRSAIGKQLQKPVKSKWAG